MTTKTPNFDEFTEITDAEFKAFDPKIQREITMNQFDKVHLARMRDAIAEDPYKAMSQGYFGGEPIDTHDNAVYNTAREFGRAITRTAIDLPASAGLMLDRDENAEHLQKSMQNPKFLEKLGITNDPDKIAKMQAYIDERAEKFEELKKEYEKRLDRNDERLTRWFGENRDTVMGDIGGGFGSMMSLVGASVLGGLVGGAQGAVVGGTLAAGTMGVESGARIYKEGRAAGLDDDDAYNRGVGYAVVEGALERVGVGLLWKSAGRRLVMRALRGFVVEGSEEGLQQLAEDLIMNDVRGQSALEILQDVGYSAAIGGIAGAPGGMLEGGLRITPKARQEYIDKLTAQGIDKASAEQMVDKVAEAFADENNVMATMQDVLNDQLDAGQYPNGNYADAQKVWQSISQDAMDEARHDIDIRDDIKARTQGLDESTQNVVADAVQNFADVISDDFGITQREFMDKVDLKIKQEVDSAAQKFDDGTRINEFGQLVDKDGKVLFQRIGQKGANDNEKQALAQAVEMEKAGYDNDSIKKSTGWSRGLDDNWWLETGGDYKYKLDALAVPKSAEKATGVKIPITDVIDTDNFERYPKLRNIVITFVNRPGSSARGHYNPATNELQLNLARIGADKVQLVRTLAHEIDHYIARQEGFESGSTVGKVAEKAVAKQVARHEKRMLAGLRNLGLMADYNNYLTENDGATNFDAVSYASGQKYTHDDYAQNSDLRKQLQNVLADAFIVDRYGSLGTLNEKEKLGRLQEAYTNTIGEMYARRASNVVGLADAKLRELVDEQSPETGALVSPNAPISQEIQNTINIELADMAAELQRESGGRFNQSAFAGSRIDYDTPSLEAIGTGEGVQAHGWGLYYALNREIAETYRQKFVKYKYDVWVGGEKIPSVLFRELSGNALLEASQGNISALKNQISRIAEGWQYGDKRIQNIISQGKELIAQIDSNPKMSVSALLAYSKDRFADDHYRWERVVNNAKTLSRQENRKTNIQDVRNEIAKHIEPFETSENERKKAADIVMQKGLDTLEARPQTGQVHEVDIPDNPFLLDEQKKLSQQSDYIQDRVKKLIEDVAPETKDFYEKSGDGNREMLRHYYEHDADGQDLYNSLSHVLGSAKAASLKMRENGIKGIAYGGIRDGRCFVIFNADDVKVIQKFYDQNDGDVRGYFDWTDKMHQVIQIMQSGDLDTVLHELGHFFSVNYINMAIESGKTEKLQPLLEYYKIENPRLLMTDESIQEDLAVKFLSYLKTDQSPRGFRKYFDMVKDWLVKTWDSLKAKGLVQTDELPDEIVRFFDNITIRRPKNINLQNAANEKARLKKILHDARVGKLDGVSDADIRTIEELLKTATARIPRMPKSLYNKLWGQLNIKFAETHDLLPLMGIDEKAKYLATSKNGGIKDEQGLLEWLQDEGFIFGDGWSNNASQDMMRWDDALRLIGNAKNTYSIDDAVRVQEIENMRQAQEIARDVLDGQDSYNAMADIDSAKSAIQRVNDAVDRNKALNKALAADYKKLSAEVRKAKAGTSEMRKAVKTAVSFLYAQDIPTDLKAKFMRSLPMVHDSRSLAKWIAEVRDRAEKEYSDLAFRGQRDRLKHELQETYSPNKRNIKYDYEHNTLFNDLRRYNTLSAEKAQEEIQKFYDGDAEKSGLSREDELRKMMLEYRANLPRRQMSGAFMDELIGRIQEAKLIGRDAIDEIQYHRGLERMEARDEILDAIAANKAGKLDKHFAGISDFKSLLNTITNSKIADKFNMVGREINAGIAAAARQTESMAEVLRINERPVSDNPRKNAYEFLKYKAELCEPIDELNVSYTDHHGRKVVVGVDNGKKVFSRAHIMDMYNQYKDPKSRELMDKFYGEWQMDHLFSYLTDQDKQTADYLMERLRDIYDMVNPVYVSLYQKDMPRKKIYWPRQSNHEIDHELLERFDGEAREANFTKSRSHGAIPVFNRDVFSNYQAHEKDAQYMVHQAKAFKDAADIFDDSTIKEAIKNKFGKEVAGELSEHLKALSIGGVRKARAQGDTVLNQFFGQIIGSKVNLSPFVMMKQLTSFGAFSANMPLGQYYRDFTHALVAPRQTYKYMMEHVGEYLRNRYGRGVNETMAAMIDPTRQNFMDRIFGSANRAAFNEFLSRLVRTGDVGAIVYGGYPRLKFLIEEKDAAGNLVRTHDEAVNAFIKESEETQQSATNAAQSNWQRTGKTKVFAMYKTSQIQYFRRVANAYNQMSRGEITRGQFIKTTAIFTAQMAIGYKLMGDLLSAALFGWDDDKDLVDELGELAGAIFTQAFDAWGAIGYFVNQGFGVMTGQKRQAELSLVGYSDILQTINNANKIKNGKAGNAHFWVQTFAPLIEGTTGAPISRYNRVLKKTGIYNAFGI